MTAPSATVPGRAGNIPAELTAVPQWVTFATAPGKGGKLAKRPFTPGTQSLARSNDPTTWRTHDAALADMAHTGRSLGFCFTPGLPYVFLDFDDVLGAHGAVKAYAATVIDTLDSYSEVSAGGQGVHVIVRGALPERFDKSAIGGPVEVYPQVGGRFCLMTGITRPSLGSMHGIIEERTAELAALFPPRPAPEPRVQQNGHHPATAELSDDEMATIVDAMRPHWSLGQKHHMGLALGGLLAKNGVSIEQALTMAARLSTDDANPRDREKAIRDSYARAAAGLDVKGYQALLELMPEEARTTVDGVLSRVWQAQQPVLVTPGRGARLLTAQRAGNEPGESIDRWPAPPPEVYHGWFAGYLDLVRETTEAPDQFHLASALTIIGAYAGRNVYTRIASGRVYPNLYTVLVGLSSESKKDTAIKRAWDMAMSTGGERQMVALPYVERNGVASAESFIKGLTTNSNVIIRMSEFSEILANARRKGTTTILTMLMKAWDNPPLLSNDSIANPATAIEPYVSILAGTQPDVLATDLIGTDISSGFANRIFFVPGSGKGRNPWPPDVDEGKLHAHWKRVRDNLRAYGTNELLPVNRTPEVTALWEGFYTTSRGETAIERTMAQRHQNMVLKIALIYAMSDCSKTIEIEHLQHAIAFVEWEWSCVKVLMGDWATGNDNRLRDRILAVLTKFGPMKRRDLQRRTKDPKWTDVDLARMVRAMIENGTLGMNDDGLMGIRDD